MTKTDNIFSFVIKFVVFGLIIGIIGIVILYLFQWTNKITTLLLTWSCSFVIISSGYLANYWAFMRSHKIFLSILLGGMMLRIVLLVGFIVVVYFTKWVEISWFLILLAIYYFLFQTVEVALINRQLKLNKKNGK